MKKNFILLSLLSIFIASSCSKTIESAQNGLSEPFEISNEPLTPSLERDSLALVALYNALGGDQTTLYSWKTAPIRKWEGVKIEKVGDERRVTEVRIGGRRLNGSLPAQIKDLTALRVLVLCQNENLSGTIIDEVYELKNLEVLNFSFTNLTGELSSKIGNLEKLDTLDLRTSLWVLGGTSYEANQHRIGGTIPAEIGKLTAMRYFDISRQGFDGELPTEIENLVSLNYMSISDCKLSGTIPAEIGKLQNLLTIFADNNHFSGSIPQEICGMKNLQQLYFSNNELSGEIPANIGEITSIREISLSGNQLTGTIPQSLEKAINLGILDLSQNQLTGTIPSELGNNFKIVKVYLNDNNLIGSLPNLKFKYMPGVVDPWACSIVVTNNRLTGDVPATMLHFSDYAKNLIPQQSGYSFNNL